jgi:hypothetical protein
VHKKKADQMTGLMKVAPGLAAICHQFGGQ